MGDENDSGDPDRPDDPSDDSGAGGTDPPADAESNVDPPVDGRPDTEPASEAPTGEEPASETTAEGESGTVEDAPATGEREAADDAPDSPAEGADDSPAEGADDSPAEGADDSPAEGADDSPADDAPDSPAEGTLASPADLDPDDDAEVVEFSATGGGVDDADDADAGETGSDDSPDRSGDATDGQAVDGPGPFATPGPSVDAGSDGGTDGTDGADDADTGSDGEEWNETDAVVGEEWDGTYADEEVETEDWDGPYAPADADADGTDAPADAESEPWADRQAAEAEGIDTGPSPSPSSPSPGATAVGAGAGPGAPGGTGAPTAPDDQEMPLTEHIEEMVTRLGVVLVVMALVSGVVFPFADRLINFLWYSFLPGTVEQCPTTSNPDVACPTLYHPLALMFARLKIASLAGFVVALPVMVYESYLFMRPGLYPRERRYYLASVPTSLVLACTGVLFAYFLILPVLFQYFTGYTSSAAEIAFGLTDTFNLIVMMLGFFALVFQIPLLVMLAIMMGVTSRRWLADKRLYFWGAFATIAFIFSPDPTGMAPILVAVTMIGLFEGTLFLLRWTGN